MLDSHREKPVAERFKIEHRRNHFNDDLFIYLKRGSANKYSE